MSNRNASAPLGDLRKMLNEITVFVRKEVARHLLESLLTKEARITQIECYQHEISSSIVAFEVSS